MHLRMLTRRFSMWWDWRLPQGASKSAPWLRPNTILFTCQDHQLTHQPSATPGRTKLFSWWRFVEIHSARQITVLAELGLNESVLAAIKLFSSNRQFCVRSVHSQSACGGVLRILPSVFFWKRSRIAQRDFLRTLRRGNHTLYQHPQTEYPEHSATSRTLLTSVSVVLKFQPFFTLRTEPVGHCGAKTTSKALFFQT